MGWNLGAPGPRDRQGLGGQWRNRGLEAARWGFLATCVDVAWLGEGGRWEETEKGLEPPPLFHLNLSTAQLLAVLKAKIVAMELCQRFR